MNKNIPPGATLIHAGIVPLVRPSFPPYQAWAEKWRAATEESGQFSNFGQLWRQASEKLETMTGMIAFPCSSGTEAVGLAIQAAKSQRDVRRFDVEAFTFEATHIAAERFEGFDRVVRSTDAGNWTVRTIPFGCQRQVPDCSVIDAAGAFGPHFAAGLMDCPIAVSFHATKNFPIGEGGCVFLPKNWTAAAADMMEAMNFGFDDERKRNPKLEHVGNGKLDELRCALLLAQLDRVDFFKARSERIQAQSGLLQQVVAGVRELPYETGHWQSLVVVQIPDPDNAVQRLAQAGLTARRVYAPSRFPELLTAAERDLVALPSDMTPGEYLHCGEVLSWL